MTIVRTIWVVGLTLLLSAAGGCERVKAPSASQSTTCPRIVSAGPNVTEICFAMGLGNCLVGRTRFCMYPPEAEAIASIGGLDDVSVESLLELRPELILVSGKSQAIAERLLRLELRYESVPDDTLDDLFSAITQIGALSDREAQSRELNARVRGELDAVRGRHAGTPQASVLLTLNPLTDPPAQIFAAGPGSFYDDLIRLAGHRNAAAVGGRAFSPLSLESILAADPDVIVELTPDGTTRPDGDLQARRIWAKVGPLRAVEANRVHVLEGHAHFILGPRIAQTFEALCATIAGDDAR